MKKELTLLTVITTLTMITGCSTDDSFVSREEGATVRFYVTPGHLSRATESLGASGITDLWILSGSSVVSHQVPTDPDFGSPEVTLTYGKWPLRFIASKAPAQTVGTTGVWGAEKIKDTYVLLDTIDVTPRMEPVGVVLGRRNYQVKFIFEDTIPKTVTTFEVKVLGTSKTLSADSLLADRGTDVTSSIGIASAAGKSGITVTTYWLPVSDTEIETRIETKFVGTSGEIIGHREFTVPALPNRQITVTGRFFGAPATGGVTLETGWTDGVTVEI